MEEHLQDPRFMALYEAATSQQSLGQFFQLLGEQTLAFPDHAETLVRKARIRLAFRVLDLPQEEHEIDLKTGPVPVFRLVPTSQDVAEDRYDLIVSVDTKQRFLDLLTRKEDGMKAYSSGSVKLVKGSMRAILKLRSLQELAERWKQDAQQQPAGEVDNNATMGDAGQVMQGYLEKQSDWLKRWNSRFVVLKWSETTKPVLKIYSRQIDVKSASPRHSFELHSSMRVSSQLEDLRITLTDPRLGNQIVCILQCPSQRSLGEWTKAFGLALQARNQAVEDARKQLSGPNAYASFSSGGLLDLLLATQRECSKHADLLETTQEFAKHTKEQLAGLETKVQEADEFLLYSTLESDWQTLLRSYGWKCWPVAALLGLGVRQMYRMAKWMVNALPSTFGPPALLVLTASVFHWLTQSPNADLIRRRVKVYQMALGAIWRLKLSSLKAASLPPIHSQAMWNVEFRINAERLYLLALELRGLWVKSAQFLGARPDIMPDQALMVLKRLHDDVPATPFSLVRPIVEQELGGKLGDLFHTFQEDPLAAASIGQVHVATLPNTMVKVVVKVQHPGVEHKITQDLTNMGQIVRLVEWIEPDVQGRDLVDEWSREVAKELDFAQEGVNMLEVGANLAKHPHQVFACLPVPISYTKRTLVMRFVTGAKVDDLDVLRRATGVETDQQRSTLAIDICTAFACQIFLDGVFQADAHPGNILVARRSDVDPSSVQFLPPVPLGGGEDRAIPILLDFGLTKRLSPRKRLAFSRMICAMQQMDIAQLLYSFEEMGLRLKREDPMEDLNEIRFTFRETSDAKQSREETMRHLEKAKAKMETRSREELNPVESFPTELMLFFRTIFLLRGLCTSLKVQVKYLRIMGEWARKALLEHYTTSVGIEVNRNELERRLCDRLNSTKFVGLQVCVLHFGQSVADFGLGVTHNLEQYPVTTSTLFPCLGLGQGVAQIVLRRMLANKAPGAVFVKEVWPQYPNPSLRLDDLIQGINLPFSVSAVPDKFFMASMHKWKDHIEFALSKAMGDRQSNGLLPWELSSLSYLWGWTMVGVMQALMTPNGDTCAYEMYLAKQAMGVLARAPESELPPPITQKGVLSEEEDTAREIARVRTNCKYAKLSVDLERMSGGAFDLDKLMTSAEEGIPPTSGGGGMTMGGMDLQSILGALDASLKGKEYLLDPRVMNAPSARSSASPSCNLLSTACGLAHLYDEVGKHGEWMDNTSNTEVEPLSERLGIKVFEFKQPMGSQIIRGFGQVAFGGSLVFTIPSLQVSCAVL
ncbi:hypothetical protein BASA81_012435 [Batrachochytrium salamandrivorans]|nr:hypothetical protein BASA81_012435 [Batrachochytrium salamandrivorans]